MKFKIIVGLFFYFFCLSLTFGDKQKLIGTYIQDTEHGFTYTYKFKPSGKVLLLYDHFELRKRKYFGHYSLIKDTVIVEIDGFNNNKPERYLIIDSCLYNYNNQRCVYKKTK